MKHPALARVFSVVLAVMCLLMLINGITGFQKADAEHSERRAYAEKYAARISSFEELENRAANSLSYDEARQELEKLLAEHEEAASQHRTDTALYTAGKGGNTMGANLIWEYMAEVKAAKTELETAQSQFDGVEEAYAAVKGDIAQILSEAGADADAGSAELGQLRAAIEEFSALLASEPKLPEGFSLPDDPGEEPAEPVQPESDEPLPPEGERPVSPEEPGDDADEAEIAAWQEALSEYEAANEVWAAYDAALEEYQREWEEYTLALEQYQTYPERRAEYDAARARQAEYDAAHAAWEEEVRTAAEAFPLNESMAVLSQLAEDLETLSTRTSEIVNTFNALAGTYEGVEIDGAAMGGMDLSILQRVAALSEMDLTNMTGEQLLEAANTVADTLAWLCEYFEGVADPFAAIDKVLADAKALLDAAEQALKLAEHELQTQLENIWYNLGELEKDKEKLAEEKQELDAEALFLGKQVLQADELKTLQNRLTAARQLLLAVPEVRKAAAESDDLAAIAKSYLEEYTRESEKLLQGKRLINAFALAGALAGFSALPAAFEKTKRRVLLLGPVLLCFLLAAAADLLNMSLGLGQMYTALFTAIFAFIQLLVVLPQKRSAIRQNGEG